MKKILIIDTKAGNLFSLKAALTRLNFEVVVLQKPDEKIYDGFVIPGQGRFGTVMNNIRDNGWDTYLEKIRLTNKPILGICVGMQIFFESSEEDKNVPGLAWLEGRVQALNFPKKPMVGWAQLNSKLFADACVYFVNSFAVKKSNYSIANVSYGESFCAAVKFDNFLGLQFHPEKSADAGSQIINLILTGEQPSV